MHPNPSIRTFYEFQPIFPLTHGWQLLLAFVLAMALAVFVIWLSLQDSGKLPRGIAALFVFLRIIALAGLIVYLLNPNQRSETRIVKESRLPVLIDTSLSMGLASGDRNSQTSVRRIDSVVDWLANREGIQPFRAKHEIMIYRFDESEQPELVASYPKLKPSLPDANALQANSLRVREDLSSSRFFGWLASAVAFIGMALLVSWIGSLFGTTGSSVRAILVCASTMMFVGALILFAWADLRAPEFGFLCSVGWISTENSTSVSKIPDPSIVTDEIISNPAAIDWTNALTPRGASTQIGAALQSIVNQERGGPIAGLILITDGGNNAGISPIRGMAAASDAGIPIFPVGLGSSEIARNVEVVDVQAPPRVFPADKFQIKGMIKAYGLAGTSVQVTLFSVDERNQEAETMESETMIVLSEDGEGVPVNFNVSQLEQGKRRYLVRVANVVGDLEQRDNERSALVEIVDRQTRVLLMAGGPTREFRFLRNQLYRDKDILLNVWLQSAQEGADQEADVLLKEFPKTRAELFKFDCIIGFDPDWRILTTEQTQLLERWVAEKAGGMIVIAGPVNTPEWTRRPRGDEAIDNIRRLYPVSFYSQGSAQLRLGRFGGSQAFPLDFSREGRAAEYLWLGDTAADSKSSWSRFEGVFGYYAVNEPKAGADVLANFADPSTSVDDRLPIYLASQFYGAGRVFFQASGEMWRVRRLDVEYFQQYYTKLIRWASQGRLLRDSTRGVLFTDRERCWLGDLVKVQAMLTNLQDEPLTVPEVNAILTRPDGSTEALVLRTAPNAIRPGSYTGQFPASLEGEYRVSMTIPDSTETDVLTAAVLASIPDLEKERPQRNDALLSAMAEKTKGHYYIGMDSLDLPSGDPFSPTQLIQPQDQVTYLTGSVDLGFQRKLMIWLWIIITYVLALEWTIRRLHKLA
jgi:hypothetical protein